LGERDVESHLRHPKIVRAGRHYNDLGGRITTTETMGEEIP
jgi:hypothetical protein